MLHYDYMISLYKLYDSICYHVTDIINDAVTSLLYIYILVCILCFCDPFHNIFVISMVVILCDLMIVILPFILCVSGIIMNLLMLVYSLHIIQCTYHYLNSAIIQCWTQKPITQPDYRGAVGSAEPTNDNGTEWKRYVFKLHLKRVSWVW